MATLQIVDNFSNSIANTVQTTYTAKPIKSVVIESFTVTNNSGVNASYKAYIVSNGGNELPIRPFKIVVWGELDLGIGIVGQAIPPGGSLRVESSALDSLYFTLTGREVSV